MRSLLGILIYNWKLKLAAFTLAMLLWITVTSDQVVLRPLEVPIEVQLLDPNFEVIDGPRPQDVIVRFSGPWRELWDLAINRPPVRLTLREVSEGTHFFLLDPQQVQLPGRRNVTPIDIRPLRVQLTLQRVATVLAQVEVPVGDVLPPELILVDTLVLSPSTIRVTGPAHRVDAIQTIPTRPLELPRSDGAFERRVAIDTTGIGDLELSADEVVIAGRIERTVQQLVPEVAVDVPAGVLVIPGSVDVELSGPESRVRGLDVRALRVVVLPESIPSRLGAAGAEVPVQVQQLPPGVQARTQPRVIRVLAAPEPPPAPEIRTPQTQPLQPPQPQPAQPTQPIPDTLRGAQEDDPR